MNAPSSKRKYRSYQSTNVAAGGNNVRRRYVRPRVVNIQQNRLAAPIRYNQRHIGGEIKSVDVTENTGGNSFGAFTVNSTAEFTALNLLTAGSSAWNRVGRKVSLKSVHLRGFAVATVNASVVYNQYVRIMIVYDKQSNGALPAIADVLRDQNNSAADTNLTGITSGINLNNRDRFEIIADCEYVWPGQTNTVTTGIVTATSDPMHVEIYRKLKGRETHYKADSAPGVIGDIASGCLFLLTFGNVTAGAEAWYLNASIRVRFSDL